MTETDKEVIYYDVPKSPPPAPVSQLPSGSADDTPPHTPSKRMSTFSKVAIGSIVVSSIVLAVVLTRPGALTAFGKQPDASSRSGGVDDNSTYVPTYFPTFVPTMNGTTSPVASPTLPPMSDLSSPPPSSPSDGSAVPTSYVPTAMDNGTTVPSPKPTLDLSFLHPVCGESFTSKVFKILWNPKEENATYSFYDKQGTIYSETNGTLPVGVEHEDKICVEAGTYEFEMSDGACATGFVRGIQIFWSCVAGTSKFTIAETA